ncbi:unnamed protein product [Mucor hiemalis]
MSQLPEKDKDETISELTSLVQSLEAKQQETDKVVELLKNELAQMRQQLTGHDELHASVLSQLNTMKEHVIIRSPIVETVMQPVDTQQQQEGVIVKRSIPAPSKFLVEEQKKKDNRLLELRRITKEYKNVDDEEAGLRLYKLQKQWFTSYLNTQRVAFEMVEREAISLGVPLNMCIGYWGARRLISKSWANALRTSKKNTKPEEPVKSDEDASRLSKKIKTFE